MSDQPESVIIKFKASSNINIRNSINMIGKVRDKMWEEFTGIRLEVEDDGK